MLERQRERGRQESLRVGGRERPGGRKRERFIIIFLIFIPKVDTVHSLEENSAAFRHFLNSYVYLCVCARICVCVLVLLCTVGGDCVIGFC